MSTFNHTLGYPVPFDDHACSVILPHWADIVGYEEGDKNVVDAMKSGYPRFKIHASVELLFNDLNSNKEQLQVYKTKLTSFTFPTRQVAQRFKSFLIQNLTLTKQSYCSEDIFIEDLGYDSFATVYFPEIYYKQGKAYWQHTGEILSSRQAEDALHYLGLTLPEITKACFKTHVILIDSSNSSIDAEMMSIESHGGSGKVSDTRNIHLSSDVNRRRRTCFSDQVLSQLQTSFSSSSSSSSTAQSLSPSNNQQQQQQVPASLFEPSLESMHISTSSNGISSHSGTDNKPSTAAVAAGDRALQIIRQRLAHYAQIDAHIATANSSGSATVDDCVTITVSGMAAIFTAFRLVQQEYINRHLIYNKTNMIQIGDSSNGNNNNSDDNNNCNYSNPQSNGLNSNNYNNSTTNQQAAATTLLAETQVVVFGFPYIDTLKLMQRAELNPGACLFLGRGDDRDLLELEAVLKQYKVEDDEAQKQLKQNNSNNNNDDGSNGSNNDSNGLSSVNTAETYGQRNNKTKKVIAVFTEFPSNPLLFCPDLVRLTELALAYDFLLVVDDTISTCANIDLFYQPDVKVDILCTSLTKLFNGRGDVMAGAVMIHPTGRHALQLTRGVDSGNSSSSSSNSGTGNHRSDLFCDDINSHSIDVNNSIAPHNNNNTNNITAATTATSSHHHNQSLIASLELPKLYYSDALTLEINSRDFLQRAQKVNNTAWQLVQWLKTSAPYVQSIFYPCINRNDNHIRYDTTSGNNYVISSATTASNTANGSDVINNDDVNKRSNINNDDCNCGSRFTSTNTASDNTAVDSLSSSPPKRQKQLTDNDNNTNNNNNNNTVDTHHSFTSTSTLKSIAASSSHKSSCLYTQLLRNTKERQCTAMQELQFQPGYGCLFTVVFTQSHRFSTKVFYDALNLCKGPSLGTNFTLVCPYTLLAHYYELPWAAQFGVERDLIRVSVGLEDLQYLKDRFSLAIHCASLPLTWKLLKSALLPLDSTSQALAIIMDFVYPRHATYRS